MNRVAFATDGAHAQVALGEERFRPHVESLFPTLVADPDPEAEPLAWLEEGQRTPYRLRLQGGVPECVEGESLPDLLGRLEYTLFRALLAPYTGMGHLHAAGAVVGEKAVLALGASGAGKSSLALHWAREGIPLLGDDLVLVDGDSRVMAFPRLLKVDRERLEEVGIHLECTVAPDPSDPEAWWHPSPGGWYRGVAPVGLVAEIRFVPGGSTWLRRVEPARALQLLLAHALVSGLPPEEAVDRFLPLAEEAQFVSLEFGNARDAAQTLTRMVRSGSP